MMKDNEGTESTLLYGYMIKHVHIAKKEGRAAPGTGNENFKAYFEALKNVGYQGRISIECGWKDLGTQAATAIAAIKKQL